MCFVTSVLLIRHAQSSANVAGVLAGRAPGVGLTPEGVRAARGLRERLAGVEISQVWSSPLRRCRETAEHAGLDAEGEPRLLEADYGSWTGRSLTELAAQPEWVQVQREPSKVVFPDGESMRAMAERAASVLEDVAASGAGVVALVTHADPAKAILAHALAMGLDQFQRLVVSPASVSVIEVGQHPRVWAMNSLSGPVRELIPFSSHADR